MNDDFVVFSARGGGNVRRSKVRLSGSLLDLLNGSGKLDEMPTKFDVMDPWPKPTCSFQSRDLEGATTPPKVDRISQFLAPTHPGGPSW